MRRTKILATLGPASSSPGQLGQLVAAGADALRLNFSHGTPESQRRALRTAHAIARRMHREIALVADLQGPKIRIGDLAGGSARLTEGEVWTLANSRGLSGPRALPVHLPGLATAARPGDPIRMGDGSVELSVERAGTSGIRARVLHGGTVTSHAGLHLPTAQLRTALLAKKDRADLRLALAEGVDYVAVSFVRSESDIRRARNVLDELGGSDVGLIAKIERGQAIASIEGILERSDGIMVARGDLGIDVPLERLALEQKRLVERANAHGKPVIVATQMLLSMMQSPRPTRAEATDVANAVLDGADALLLSEESAIGPYAREAVGWLDRIARATEDAVLRGETTIHAIHDFERAASEGAVASAAVQLAHEVDARAIVTPTHSGRTARLVSARRPMAPIIALSHQPSTRRRLALVWGVTARPSPKHLNRLELRELARRASRTVGARKGQPAVLTAGFPVEGRPTNLVTVVD